MPVHVCFQFIAAGKAVLGRSLNDCPWPVFLPLWVAAYILKNLIFTYNVAIFVLLSWSDCWKVCVCVLLTFLYSLLLPHSS